MASRNIGYFLRLNVNINEGFHFYNLAVMTLVRNKQTWEYSRLSSLPTARNFFAKEALSRETFPVESIGERDRRLYSLVGNRLNPI